jgi:hypothetical protein
MKRRGGGPAGSESLIRSYKCIMSSSLSDAFAAARLDPAFSLEDCRDLDLIVRHRGNDLHDLPPFSEDAIQNLCRDLNIIANWFGAQSAIGTVKPPMSRANRLLSIEKKATQLLAELGMNADSHPHEISVEHLLPGGIFANPDIKLEPLIRALQEIALHASEALDKLRESGVEAQRRNPEPNLYRLYDDLGAVYKAMWGRGRLSISVNAGKGGPGIRYFEFTLRRILGEPVKHQAIKDAIEKIKSDGVNLGGVYSVFSPEGGRRI